MTNRKIISIVLGIMCLALTAGICIQIKTVENSGTTVSQNYTENNLRAEVLRYKERYDNIIKEIENLDNQLNTKLDEVTKNNSELEDIQNQIKEGNKIIGLTEVTGPGVTITLTESNIDPATVFDPSVLLLHDMDILSIVNELRNTGAEAISINDQRVLTTTSIKCGGAIININGERVGAPFEIKAIGLPENLANLDRPGGYLDSLREKYQIGATLKKSDKLTIPKYSGVISYKYMSTIK